MGSAVTITPDTTPNPQVTITPDTAAPKKYLPGRQFGMEVAKGMGLDAEKIKAAEDSGGQEAALREIGSQVFEGLSGFAGNVLKDPFNITQPLHGMASSVEEAIKQKSPGQLMGALSNILGGAEGASKTAEVAGKVRPKVGEMIHTPEGELTPGAEIVGKVGGGAAGAAAGAAIGHEYLGAAAGYKMGPSLMERLFPEPKTVAEARARAEAYQAKAEDLMRRGKEQEALDRKASASQRLKDKLAAQAAKNAPKPDPFPDATSTIPQPTKVEMMTDSNGIRWAVASDGARVSIPKSIADADAASYAGPKLTEQRQILSSIKDRTQAQGASTTSSGLPQGNATPFPQVQKLSDLAGDDLISRTKKLVKPGEEPTVEDLKRAGDLTQVPLKKLRQLASWGDKLAQNEINRRLRNQ